MPRNFPFQRAMAETDGCQVLIEVYIGRYRLRRGPRATIQLFSVLIPIQVDPQAIVRHG
jgi:hypothetical protein